MFAPPLSHIPGSVLRRLDSHAFCIILRLLLLTAKLQFQDINSLRSTIRSATDILPEIPGGRKNNCTFVTRLAVDPNSKRVTYADDCGIWKVTAGATTLTNYVMVDERLVYVAFRDGKYCTGGRKGKWIPLTPQPQPTDVVKVHRHYATLQADESYRKRVTWFQNLPGAEDRAVAEYQGVHPGINPPHGNAKNDRPFVRTKPDTLRRVAEKVRHRQPRDVYQSMVEQDSVNAPRDLPQVSHFKN